MDGPLRRTTAPRSGSALRRLVRSLLPVALKVAVSVGILLLIFRYTDLTDVIEHMRQAQLAWMALALACYGLMIGISAWRWRVLLRTQDIDTGLGWLTNSMLVATFFNNFLPSNIGGDVVRIADTAPIAGSKTVATTVILVDRALGLLALLLVAGIGGWLAQSQGLALAGTRIVWIGALIITAVGALFLTVPRLVPMALAPLTRVRPDWVEARIGRLHDTLERLGDRPGDMLLAFAGAVVVQIVLVLFYLAVARGLGAPLPLVHGLVVVPISLVVQMAPISINGFGVREAVFSFYFSRFGFGIDAGVALSLVSAFLIILFSLGGGLLFLMRARGATTPGAGTGAD